MSYPNWLLWLAGTLPPLALLWLLWRLALRPERCYRHNRALLLLAPVLAAAWPLLPHPALPAWLAGSTVAPPGPVAAVLLPEVPIGATAPHAAAVVAHWPGLLALYLAGVALGLGRLGWQLLRLRRLARRLPRIEYEGYTLARTGGRLPTSTFGRVVFWDETAALAPAEVAAVLAHELAHVRQRHTADVLWLQIWRIVLWPNPFAHLLLPALRLTHELLADAEAAAETAAQPYAPLLARLAARRLAAGPAGFALLHPFAFSSILTRIAMLNNQLPVRRWKQWLVLPLLGGLWLTACRTTATDVRPAPDAPVTLVSEPYAIADKVAYRKAWKALMREDSLRNGTFDHKAFISTFRVHQPTGVPGMGTITITYSKKNPLLVGEQLKSSDPPGVYAYVEQYPQLPGEPGMAALVKAIQDKLTYPAGNTTEGRVFAKFIVRADGSVSEATIIKSLSAACDRAVLDAIYQLPRLEPGRQDGRAVAVSLTVPVTFKTQP